MTVERLRRRRSPRGSGEQLRAEILTAATELLLESGDESAVSIRAVANRVGVTPPSIYIHFADKDTLIDEVVAQYFTRLDEVMRAAGAEHEDSWEAAHAQGMAYVRFAVENAELYRVATMKVCAEGTDADAVLGQSAFVHFAETIERLMDEGFVDKGDPTPVVLELWTAAHGVAALMIAKPYIAIGDDYELAERVLTSVCLGRATKDLIGGDVGPTKIRDFIVEQRSRRGPDS
ncbi:TetR/AcrR family transcriptional regulator [Williamsia sp. DF01-3]|jgi:AcrR family transcriptional regulator|uniref:TetR/AcrR family transcriptional regulator n=1 Tax=Williamsia sp. DF01-3 TaxID=2934157 RepID=UPI001FF410FC|nr:TetR/AcrR family transcriptional regulator [Williamsia sp. DF01-3]MCK0518038.1 TetR/AcrR family transcriptional regulator [Williamsia sp. DF01-3]